MNTFYHVVDTVFDVLLGLAVIVHVTGFAFSVAVVIILCYAQSLYKIAQISENQISGHQKNILKIQEIQGSSPTWIW